MKWLPGIILALAAIVLAFAWSEIPDRWTIHWGMAGHADGWASKDALGVFGPLLLGALVWMLIESLVWFIGQANLHPAALASTSEALRLTEVALALTVAIASIWLPLGRPTSPLGLVVVSLLVMLVCVAASLVRMVRAQPKTVVPNTSEGGWHGPIYHNATDQRLWVPKRSGLGLTLNFAHRMAWPVLMLMILVPVTISVVFAAMAGRH